MMYTIAIKDVQDQYIDRMTSPIMPAGSPVWDDYEDAARHASIAHRNDPNSREYDVYGVDAESPDTAIDVHNPWSVLLIGVKVHKLGLENFRIINSTERYTHIKSGQFIYLYAKQGRNIVDRGFLMQYDKQTDTVCIADNFANRYKGTVTNTLYFWKVPNATRVTRSIAYFRSIKLTS